ncbi:alpha/beta fold hydrolase, partial [Dietzia sp. SLG310A2-38A2]|uniref:esterase/lipase family protein n=1 Tax=Dietzia sp. SLG310A2-38A2 TaxID=1630643 RepID=UPI0015FAF0C3
MTARRAVSGIAGLVAAALLVVVAPGPVTAAPTTAAPTTAFPTTASPTTVQVPWRWWDGAAHQLTNGLADPPGINRDDCRPSARHPVPVILVHGTGLNGGNSWATFGAALAAEGYCVWAPTVGAPPGLGSTGGFDSLTGASAPQLAAEIDRVRALTGAPEVDLVGHSQGAIIASYVTATTRRDA